MYEIIVSGVHMTFESSDRLFSPRAADLGTLAMLSALSLKAGDKVLDLGCGYGLVGVWAARIASEANAYMTDIASDALTFARKNAENNGVPHVHILRSDGFNDIAERDFDYILSNPPYHADFSVAKRFIEQGYHHLKLGGRLLMVTKRKEWYKNKFIAVFGGVSIAEIDGYFVFTGEKRAKAVKPVANPQTPSKKLRHKIAREKLNKRV